MIGRADNISSPIYRAIWFSSPFGVKQLEDERGMPLFILGALLRQYKSQKRHCRRYLTLAEGYSCVARTYRLQAAAASSAIGNSRATLDGYSQGGPHQWLSGIPEASMPCEISWARINLRVQAIWPCHKTWQSGQSALSNGWRGRMQHRHWATFLDIKQSCARTMHGSMTQLVG